jgi:predicted nucleotidyltransferase component of viral defense system
MLNVSEHRKILIQILKDIYTDTSIASYLGFKGGTACLLFHGLDRFSVDLDFDLLDVKQQKLVFEKVEKILLNYGKLKDKREKRYNLFFLLEYYGKVLTNPNIKVEINIRNFNSKYEILNFLGISMQVMTKEDILAHKLVAMYERMNKANRDIYDVYFFLNKRWVPNKTIIETRTNMKYKDFIVQAIKQLEKVDNRQIVSGLGELINDKQKNWVKTKLLQETIFLLKMQNEA